MPNNKGFNKSTRSGFTKDELNYLSSLNQEDLDKLIYASRGLDENKVSSRAAATTLPGSWNQQQTIPQNEQSTLNQPKVEINSTEDAETALSQLENKYLDPATLELRPSYADGSAPEKAIHKAIDGAAWARTKLAFSNKNPQEQVSYLEKDFGAGNVKLSKGGNITIKDKNSNAWYQLDPVGAGQGDWMEKALEKTRDILADNADLAVSVGLTVATAGAAAPLAAGLTGIAAVGGAGAVGAASGAASGMGKVLLGRLVGTYDATPEEMLKDIGLEIVLGLAGNAFIPGVKYGARELGAMFKKSAPVLAEAAPESKKLLTKIIGMTSGQGEEVASHWVNNQAKVGNELAKYGKDLESGILANINQTKQFAEEVVQAKRAYSKDIYTKFAEEAGENFAPNVGRVFNKAAVGSMPVDLVDSGILKWDGVKGVINLNSVDDIMKSNPELGSIFTEPKARRLLTPVLNVVNTFNKVSPASGKAGAEQFLTFKNRLSAALRQSQAMASEAGLDSAYMDVSKFAGQLKSAYVNRAVDGIKHPELMQKLISTDKAYQQVSELIRPFTETVKNANKIGIDAYKNLYKSTFEVSKLSANKAVAGNRLQESINLLSKYKPNLSEIVDDIGARKAALAASPWTRGGLDTAFTIGAATSLQPAAIAAMATRSPKINYQAAKLATSMYGGLDFVRKLPEASRKLMLQRPEAVAKLFDTVISTPGLEAQIGQQLGHQLMGGGQNGQ